MTFTQPLELETWIVSVFSGTPEIFTAIAIMVIVGMAGYFRMQGIGMFFMLGIFFLLFTGTVPFTFLTLILIFTGLMLGYLLSNFTQK